MRAFIAATDRWLACLYSPLALVTRVHVAWVFLKSGLLKVQGWDSTLSLFESEYRVPLLPSQVAAVLGTCAELTVPVFLILGLLGRLSALALSVVNIVAVISYAHVLLADGFEAAIAQHYLWGFMLLMLAIAGPGEWTVDRMLARKRQIAADAPVRSLEAVQSRH